MMCQHIARMHGHDVIGYLLTDLNCMVVSIVRTVLMYTDILSDIDTRLHVTLHVTDCIQGHS